MILKRLLPLPLFLVIVLSANSQEKGRDQVSAQTQTTGQQPAQTKKEKKKCWFSRKKKKDSTDKPAKEALEDRNIRDPKIDKGPKSNTRANPSALKDAKK